VIWNNPDLRSLAFSLPEAEHKPIRAGGRATTAHLPWHFTQAQLDHWSDTSVTAMYFLFRQMGYSPRQVIAAADWKLL
jgi:hypothetical protein